MNGRKKGKKREMKERDKGGDERKGEREKKGRGKTENGMVADKGRKGEMRIGKKLKEKGRKKGKKSFGTYE